MTYKFQLANHCDGFMTYKFQLANHSEGFSGRMCVHQEPSLTSVRCVRA